MTASSASATPPRSRLRRVTLIYWLLLIYIIAALVWWLISLERQNRQMATLRYRDLAEKNLPAGELARQKAIIEDEVSRNTTKYVSEGITFFILILIGAFFVYRSVRRQFRLQQQQRNFMMAVTHELKTPLSVTHLNLETLQKHHLDPEKTKKLIQSTLKETSRLNTLTNNILISSQIEGEGYELAKEDLDLSALFHDCLADYRLRHPDRVFGEDIVPELSVAGDALLLQLMINNLLENAVKYSDRHSPIMGRLEKGKNRVILQVIDQGRGIPEEERRNIFNKFYRIGNELTRTTHGTGLGLYLCSRIARDHKADIKVTNNNPQGSIFTINFRN